MAGFKRAVEALVRFDSKDGSVRAARALRARLPGDHAYGDPLAVDAAFESTRAIREIEVDGYRPELRSGIHFGKPRKLGGDYFGVDVKRGGPCRRRRRPG